MLKDGWNFHGWVAVPLEVYGRKYIGADCETADEMESGEFVSIMLKILGVAYSNAEDLSAFAEMVSPYDGLPAQKIPAKEANEMFREFERLIKNKEALNNENTI